MLETCQIMLKGCQKDVTYMSKNDVKYRSKGWEIVVKIMSSLQLLCLKNLSKSAKKYFKRCQSDVRQMSKIKQNMSKR